MGMGYVDSVKAVLFTSMIISVLGMYLFLNVLLKDRLAAILGAIFYLYAPIRFLNVYVSAAVGSALALGILPFVFWSMVRGKILWGSIFFAALILSHNVTTLIFIPVILIFAFLFKKSAVLPIFLLGLGLSSWFWMPVLIEAQYTRFDAIFGSFYKDQFPTFSQLVASPWGYGLSHPERPEPGDMSYQIGKIQLLVMGILLVSFWFFKRIRAFKLIGGFCLTFFILSILLMQKISLPIWDTLPFLSYVQFPLRFSAISVFSASIAAALLVKYLPFKKLLVFSLLSLVLYANRNHWNINQVFDPGESYYLNLKTTSTTYGEHLPKWGKVKDEPSPAKLEIVNEMGKVRILRDKSNQVLAEVEATTSSKMRLNQFYFPGWQVDVDGRKIEFNYLLEGENYGLPVFGVEAGKHLVKAELKNTPIRNLADGISLISVILWIVLLCKLLIRK